jgi:hypothetical protein
MQSTKYLLLLLAVLAFAAMDAAAVRIDNNHDKCEGYGLIRDGKTLEEIKENVRRCAACCILLGERSNFREQYKMNVYSMRLIGACWCDRSDEHKDWSDNDIRYFKRILGLPLDHASSSRSSRTGSSGSSDWSGIDSSDWSGIDSYDWSGTGSSDLSGTASSGLSGTASSGSSSTAGSGSYYTARSSFSTANSRGGPSN